jgi:hypothetical protein
VEEKLRLLHMLRLTMQSFAKVMEAEAQKYPLTDAHVLAISQAIDRLHNRYNRLERELAA